MKKNAIILAAGKGTRMKSDLPKVMHKLSGIPMVEHIIRTVKEIGVDEIFLVVGHGSKVLMEYFKDSGVVFIEQKEQLGTAHAIKQVEDILKGQEGQTLILTGDTPLIKKETLIKLYEEQKTKDGIVLTTSQENPFGYGRIVKNEKEEVLRIVEEKDATNEEKEIKEVNSGIFCINNEKLFEKISEIKNENNQKEYYLTDIVQVFREKDYSFGSYWIEDSFELSGVNDRYQLSILEEYSQKEIKKQHMKNGVTIMQPSTVYIEKDVIIEEDVVIEPCVTLMGKVIVEKGFVIEKGTTVRGSKVVVN